MNEAALHLAKAREKLVDAQVLLECERHEASGCESYLAAYHAPLAYLRHQSQPAPKTHSGVQALFHQTAKDDARIALEFRRFLGYAYNLKAIADYELGSGAALSPETAKQAYDTAVRFVACISDIIGHT